MPGAHETSGLLVTGGLGAALGGVIAAIIQTRSHKAESRAVAADIVTNASVRIIDRLEHENTRLRAALVILTEVIDEIILHNDFEEPLKRRLREANNAAKLSVLPYVEEEEKD